MKSELLVAVNGTQTRIPVDFGLSCESLSTYAIYIYNILYSKDGESKPFTTQDGRDITSVVCDLMGYRTHVDETLADSAQKNEVWYHFVDEEYTEKALFINLTGTISHGYIKDLYMSILHDMVGGFKNPLRLFSASSKSGKYAHLNDDEYASVLNKVIKFSVFWGGNSDKTSMSWLEYFMHLASMVRMFDTDVLQELREMIMLGKE